MIKFLFLALVVTLTTVSRVECDPLERPRDDLPKARRPRPHHSWEWDFDSTSSSEEVRPMPPRHRPPPPPPPPAEPFDVTQFWDSGEDEDIPSLGDDTASEESECDTGEYESSEEERSSSSYEGRHKQGKGHHGGKKHHGMLKRGLIVGGVLVGVLSLAVGLFVYCKKRQAARLAARRSSTYQYQDRKEPVKMPLPAPMYMAAPLNTNLPSSDEKKEPLEDGYESVSAPAGGQDNYQVYQVYRDPALPTYSSLDVRRDSAPAYDTLSGGGMLEVQHI